MSYSSDLRKRVLDAIDRGMARAAVVSTFQVSAGSIKRWLARRRSTGEMAPRSPPGRTAIMPAAKYPALVAQLTAHPDATLTDHIARWKANHGVTVSRWTMSRALRTAGWTRKKRH